MLVLPLHRPGVPTVTDPRVAHLLLCISKVNHADLLFDSLVAGRL